MRQQRPSYPHALRCPSVLVKYSAYSAESNGDTRPLRLNARFPWRGCETRPVSGRAGGGDVPFMAGGTDLAVQKVCVAVKGPSPAALAACILKL